MKEYTKIIRYNLVMYIRKYNGIVAGYLEHSNGLNTSGFILYSNGKIACDAFLSPSKYDRLCKAVYSALKTL
jgi:hypothetical protein